MRLSPNPRGRTVQEESWRHQERVRHREQNAILEQRLAEPKFCPCGEPGKRAGGGTVRCADHWPAVVS